MQKRKTLKSILIVRIIAYVAVLIVVISLASIYMQSSKISSLTESVLGKESISYASAVNNWWSNVEQRVKQTGDVLKNSPNMEYNSRQSVQV